MLLAGRDVEALAEPGSGKTLAYLLPAAQVGRLRGGPEDGRGVGLHHRTALLCCALHPQRRSHLSAASRHALVCIHACPRHPMMTPLQLLVTWGHGASSQPEGPLALVLLPTRELAQQVRCATASCCACTALQCVRY